MINKTEYVLLGFYYISTIKLKVRSFINKIYFKDTREFTIRAV